MSAKDGSPAFPALNYIVPSDLEARHVRRLGETQGMSLRDYFAAHAPIEPQHWFKAVMPTERPKSVWRNGERGPYEDDPVNTDEIYQWDAEAARQLLIQWPWAWADAMLAEREKAS